MWPFRRRKRAQQSISSTVETSRETVPSSAARFQFRTLSADGRLAVVGESNYQTALYRAAQGQVAGESWDDKVPVHAAVLPEPDNKFDPFAVRVDAFTDSGLVTVGYMSRFDAQLYQPVLLSLYEQGYIGTCPARITGGGHKYYGIYLHISSPNDLILANVADGLEMLTPEKMVTVTKDEDHQAALAPFAPNDASPIRRVAVELCHCVISKGKYAGQRAIEARLDGQRIGELTRQMSQRYNDVVDEYIAKGQRPGCEAVIMLTERGLQAELRLPECR